MENIDLFSQAIMLRGIAIVLCFILAICHLVCGSVLVFSNKADELISSKFKIANVEFSTSSAGGLLIGTAVIWGVIAYMMIPNVTKNGEHIKVNLVPPNTSEYTIDNERLECVKINHINRESGTKSSIP